MKYLLAVLLLIAPGLASATSFTATGSGDWNSPSTWGLSGSATCGTTIPCMTSATTGGDTVTIPSSFVITCMSAGEICSYGDSATAGTNCKLVIASTGGIHLGSQATFIYAGNFCANGAGTFIADAGSTIQHDSSWSTAPTTATYTWSMRSPNASATALWAVNGTPNSHVIWQGDSSFSPLAKAGACTPGMCLAGAIGSASQFDINEGTLTYLDVKNVAGTGSPPVGWGIGAKSINTSYTGVTFNNVAYVFVNLTAAFTANFSFDKGSFYNCPNATQTLGCLNITGNAGATGSHSLTNTIFDGPFSVTAQTSHNWVFRNLLCWSGQEGGFSHVSPCLQNTPDASVWDQIFLYNNAWTTGTTDGNLSSFIPMSPTNSVFWQERTTLTNVHTHSWQASLAAYSGSGTMFETNNVFGSMGGAGGSFIADATGGSTGFAGTPLIWTGNVSLCGYNGMGSATMNSMFFSSGGISNASITETNNTTCSAVPSFGFNSASNGSIGAEVGSIAADSIASVDSNLFYRNDGGGPIAEVCDGPGPNGGYVNIITSLSNNAVVNTTSASPPICSANTGWVRSGPRNDVIIQNRRPVLVESGRSLPLFDTEYLAPAGLLSLSSYNAAPWSSGASYSVGQYVSDSQSSAFGGVTTYWRCIQSHTASAINRPVTGVDPAHVYLGHEVYWEEAFMPFIRSAVMAGTAYTDGAIGVASAHATVTSAQDVGIVGLLNAWLRQGMTSMEPTLWNGCLNGKECGAVPLAAIQHIPPPLAVN